MRLISPRVEEKAVFEVYERAYLNGYAATPENEERIVAECLHMAAEGVTVK